MGDVLLIGLPRTTARGLESVLAGIGMGRIDATDVEEAASLMASMPVAAVILVAEQGASSVVQSLSLLPLSSEHRVAVLYKPNKDTQGLEQIQTDLVNCFPIGSSNGELKRFLKPAKQLARKQQQPKHFGQMLGECEQVREVYTLIAKVAPTNASVLICGESGTGKELVANAIHRRSERKGNAFVAVNCGAIAENLIESELFGHEKGAFTGANKSHPGVFEQADGGTLFLDEITEMPLEMQVRLLRVLETGLVRRLGAEAEMPVDVRVVAATNRNPQEAVDEGRFREDLMFRLAVFPIALPALRERGEDVLLLGRYFLSNHNAENNTDKRLSQTAEQRLMEYGWPGNVRQLRNIIHRSYIIENDTLDLDCLLDLMDGDEPVACDAAVNRAGHDQDDCSHASAAPESASTDNTAVATQHADEASLQVAVGTTIDDAEKALILKTMQEYEGDKPQVAKVLGISLKTLYNRLNSYGHEEA